MKKVLSLIALAGMFSFYACGPSAEEKAAMEKARQDSIAQIEQARQDSINAAEEARQIMEKARQDSLEAAQKQAEEAAKKGKGSKSTTTTKKTEAPKEEGKKMGDLEKKSGDEKINILDKKKKNQGN